MSSTPRRARPLAALLALSLAGALLLAPRHAAAGEERPVGRPIPYDGWMGTLPSGLQLLAYQRPGIDRVAVGVSWLAGSVDDPAGKEGLAHLVEHLAFRARSGAGTVWARLQGDGAAFNAMTEHDATTYLELGKPDQFGLLLAVEAERMRDPLAGVTEADFAAEQAIVTSELREAEQFQPWYRGEELLESRLFPAGHPYHRSVGGTAESVGRATLADARAFVKRLYTPDRALVVVIGPGPARATAERVVAALGPLASGAADGAVAFGKVEAATRPVAPMPPDPSPELVEVKAAVERPVLLVGFAVPGEPAGQLAMAQAAAANLQSELSLRFFSMVASLYGQVRGVSVQVLPRAGPAVVVAALLLQDGADARKVLEAVRDRLVDQQNGRSFEQAKISRAALLTDGYLDVERLDVASLARTARATGLGDVIKVRQRQVVEINRGTDSFAYAHMSRKRAAAVLVVPDPAAPARLVVGASTDLGDRLAERHAERGDPFLPTRPVAQVALPPGLDRATRFRLENGLEVVAAPRGTLPFAEVRLLMRTDPAGAGGLSPALPSFSVAFQGANSDERYLHDYRVGAQSMLVVEPDRVTWRMRGSSGNLDDLLEDVARWPRFFRVERSGFELWQRWMKADLEAELRNPETRGLRALHAALYPGHPYGLTPGPADVAALRLEDVRRWTTTQLRPDRATLLVVGDVEPLDALREKVRKAFGGWAAPEATPLASAPPPLPREQRVVLVDRPGAKLALLLVGLRLPEGGARDDAAAAALAWRLDSTLMETLRLDAGVTYGVRVVQEALAQSRALVIQTAVDATVAGDATGRLLAALEALVQVPLPEEALERARWQVARAHGRAFDTVALSSEALERLALEGLPPDHYEKQAASIAALDAARVQALAKKLVGHEVAVVVGDARALLPQLKEAGFDPEVAAP